MQNVEKTYRPKSGYEGCEITFPNPLTGETVEISDWPHETESSVEMAHLDAHPWLTDRPAPSGSSTAASSTTDSTMPLSKMRRSTLEKIVQNRGLEVSPDATKKELVEAIRAAGKVPEEPSPDEQPNDAGGSE